MLDDGQSETGSPCRLGTALVDPVESFKDTAPVFLGDADAVVFDFQEDLTVFFSDIDFRIA